MLDSYETAFGFDRNKDVWDTIGIVPFNRKCLKDDMVKHEVVILPNGEIDYDADPQTKELLEKESRNKEAVIVLNENGFDGNRFLKKAPKLDQSKLPMNVTVPGTRARQDLLARCTTHGARFHATNGDALNSNDVFIMMERKVREKRIEVLEKKKVRHDYCTQIKKEANEIIQMSMNSQLDLYADDLAAAKLTNPKLEILYEFKLGKKPKAKIDANKKGMVETWNLNKTKDSINIVTMNERDLEELDRLKTEVITVAHTELGKARRKLVITSIAGLSSMSAELLNAVLSRSELDSLQSKLTVTNTV